MNWHPLGQFLPYISSDDQTAELINDEHVQVRRWLAKLLLQDLQDGFHYSWGVPQCHCNVP